jgi:hypothetical protein
MNRKLAATAAAASLLVGSAAGAVIVAPSLAGAADGVASTEGTDDPRPEPGTHLRATLRALVEDGTLTEAQLDAVVDTLVEAGPPGGRHGPGRHFGPGPGLDVAAEAIGIEVDALREALESGQTIAEVAAANDVDVQVVIDAIVARMNERLDEAVANGRLSQAEADQRKADAVERATDLVNGELPAPPRFAPGSEEEDDSGSTGTTS